MSEVFSTEEFLSQTHSAGFETKRTDVEAGEYPGVIDKVAYRTMPKKDKPEENSHVVDITYFIDDARQKEITQLERPTVRQSIFLDLIDGKLDKSKNKNLGLGRLLEALGKNLGDFSFNDLIGRACMVKVEKGENVKSPQDPFTNVTKVAKLGG